MNLIHLDSEFYVYERKGTAFVIIVSFDFP